MNRKIIFHHIFKYIVLLISNFFFLNKKKKIKTYILY